MNASAAVTPSPLECPVCLTLYVTPKVLPKCGHSVCLTCLERCMSGRSVTCPECRASSAMPDGGFPTNYRLSDLAEEHRNHQSCSICNHKTSKQRLFVCTCKGKRVVICGACGVNEHNGHEMLAYTSMVTDSDIDEAREQVKKLDHDDTRITEEVRGYMGILKSADTKMAEGLENRLHHAFLLKTDLFSKFQPLVRSKEKLTTNLKYIRETHVALKKAHEAVTQFRQQLQGAKVLLTQTAPLSWS